MATRKKVTKTNGKTTKGRKTSGVKGKASPKKSTKSKTSKSPMRATKKTGTAKPKKSSQKVVTKSRWQKIKSIFWKLTALGFSAFVIFVIYCDSVIRGQFEGKRWQLPAKVYAQPLELIPGKSLTPTRLKQELDLLGYRKVVKAVRPGDYEQYENYYYIYVRDFKFWDQEQSAQEIAFSIEQGKVTDLKDHVEGDALQMARLDPLIIGQIYPNHLEDRILIQLDEIPEHLKQALIATEDKGFYEHHGISLRGIARALWHNLNNEGRAHGGSTLTQQLVKNYFLTNERSLTRKFREAVMALLLELRYEKDEILEAYFNEVFLGQDRTRAIHGVGLASSFYFDKPVSQLSPSQSALLVAILKGPSAFDPYRNPKNAIKRRNLVLKLLYDNQHLTEEEYKFEQQTTLSVLKKPKIRLSKVPAFMDLVKRQLHQSYSDDELNSQGLRIFTTLDPVIQRYTETALQEGVQQVESRRRIKSKTLQSAAIITESQSGKILALVGNRYQGYTGFNRALDARRPIGSVIKPFVVLSALEKNSRMTLAKTMEDTPLSLIQRDGSIWQPNNYDKKFHGTVTLFESLNKSYNVPMARLGQLIGVDRVARFIEKAGVDKVWALDALPLGVLELSPLQLTELYQSIASGGLKIKPSAIEAVTDNGGRMLERFPVESERVMSEVNNYLIKANMQQVVQKGTAKRLHHSIPWTEFAGKTGTTNEQKDSWFAGFSGEHLGVIWVGRDDNKSTNISGSSAALPVFINIFQGINTESLGLGYHSYIEWKLIDLDSGKLTTDECSNTASIPFVRGTAPTEYADCRDPFYSIYDD